MSDDPLVVVRRDPHFARSLQFLIFFHPAFPNLLPDTPDIKSEAALIVRLEWLLAFETDVHRLSAPFCSLIKPLLQSQLPAFTKINGDTLLSLTTRLLDDLEWPIDYSTDAATLLELSVPERCRLLCDLCEMHLADPVAFQQVWQPHVKDGESSWRLEPVGQDHAGRQYYVFDDGRLYRERSPKPQDWELLAASVREWSIFMDNGLSAKPKDKQLLQFLRNEIFPDTQPILEQVEHEEKRMIKEMEILAAPRKRSSRLQAIKEADEQRRVEEELRVKEEKKRRRMEREAESILPLSTPPRGGANGGKSREERLRERELKKLINSQPEYPEPVSPEEPDDLISVGGSQSPLKLIFKRTAEGYQSSLLTSDPDSSLDVVDEPSNVAAIETDQHVDIVPEGIELDNLNGDNDNETVKTLDATPSHIDQEHTQSKEKDETDRSNLMGIHNILDSESVDDQPDTTVFDTIISEPATDSINTNDADLNKITSPEDEAMHILASIAPDAQ